MTNCWDTSESEGRGDCGGQTLVIPVSWGLDGREVDCVGHLEVVAQSFVEHEFSSLKHYRKYI